MTAVLLLNFSAQANLSCEIASFFSLSDDGYPQFHAPSESETEICKQNDGKYSYEKKWLINPYGDENPIFEGGPSLFASSRMGQLYLPGSGVALFRPLLLMGKQIWAPGMSQALTGLASTYVAHVSWRLGCDQGYWVRKEMKFNLHSSVDSFLFGSMVKDARHPILSHRLNQTITPLALLMFGVGQTIGQAFFNPLIHKVLKKSPFFRKKLGPKLSATAYDVDGWPVLGKRFTRADSISKIMGIFIGTYIGWSLNDLSWQLTNWRKFSFDPFSEYMPYYGNDDFGSANKGWGILGFTVGGFFGHNIFASLSETLLLKTSLPKRLPKTATFIKHSSAIGGNLILGLLLTTYFPHIIKKTLHLFPEPLPTTIPLKNYVDLSAADQTNFIHDHIKISLNKFYIDFLKSHIDAINRTTDKFDGTRAVAPSDKDQSFKLPSKYSDLLTTMTKAMEFSTINFMGEAKKSIDKITSLEQMQQWVVNEFSPIIPDKMILSRSTFNQNLKTAVRDRTKLAEYKSKFYDIILDIYPLVFKYRFLAAMTKITSNMTDTEDPLITYLIHKRNLVTMQLSELASFDYSKAAPIITKYQAIHEKLLSNNIRYYEFHASHLLKDYLDDLDEISLLIANQMR